MKKKYSLKKKDFYFTYKRGCFLRSENIGMYILPYHSFLIGFSIPKKTGIAVKRNFSKKF